MNRRAFSVCLLGGECEEGLRCTGDLTSVWKTGFLDSMDFFEGGISNGTFFLNLHASLNISAHKCTELRCSHS